MSRSEHHHPAVGQKASRDACCWVYMIQGALARRHAIRVPPLRQALRRCQVVEMCEGEDLKFYIARNFCKTL